MTSTGVLIVLGLLALLGWWILKDKTFDGFAPFVVGNVVLGLMTVGTLIYGLISWLTR